MTGVKVDNDLLVPYRTGSYLVDDVVPPGKEVTPGKKKDQTNFRDAMKLPDHPYRASGSHQLNAQTLADILKSEVVDKHNPSTIYLVDLREETHGFLDDKAVSWYADNDFANVCQSVDWIMMDEADRFKTLLALKNLKPPKTPQTTTKVFTLDMKGPDNRGQQRVTPTSYVERSVGTAETEETVANGLQAKIGCRVIYLRIPVTDHCAPTEAALGKLRDLRKEATPSKGVAPSWPSPWVHFHCHGGDGRTTTFLALYDMLCWKASLRPGETPPTTEDFAGRQRKLFDYSLIPDPEQKWKYQLANVRWRVITKFHTDLFG